MHTASTTCGPRDVAGPHRAKRYGPDRRTTLVGLGAVRRPARKGAMLAGPSDFRVDLKHSAADSGNVKRVGHNWTR